ncbi:MAG: formyl transferase [Epsilonproteobacteria bacterium]|nr:formyl transferase [Campylobacterota bacterium]
MEKILFLTNNFKTTKPLYLWLAKKGNKVILHSQPLTNSFLKKLNPTQIVSYNYRHIIPKKITQNYKILNLHISYLPFNKGADPNLWSHLENSPTGVTIHYIDEGIDSGDILLQKRVVLDEEMSLKESYKKLHRHIQQLFKQLSFSKKKPQKQPKGGTFHFKKDKEQLILPNGWDTTIKELKEANENREV